MSQAGIIADPQAPLGWAVTDSDQSSTRAPPPCPTARFPTASTSCARSPPTFSTTPAATGPAPPKPRSAKASARASRCAGARSRPSSTTATRAWASRSTSASSAATPARRTSRRRRCATRCDAALSIARFTAADDCAGLADPDLLARACARSGSVSPVGPAGGARDRAGARVRGRGARGRPAHHQLRRARRVSTQQSHFIYANTLGFLGGYPSSRHSRHVLGDRRRGRRDAARRLVHHRARGRRPGRRAKKSGAAPGERCVRRLGARKIETMQVPVLFEAPIASGPARPFRRRGERRQSVPQGLVPARQPGPAGVRAASCRSATSPTCARGLASSPFDDEGVATHRARRRERRRAAGLFSGQLFGAQARHALDRQRRRQSQSDARQHRRGLPRAARARWAAGCW